MTIFRDNFTGTAGQTISVYSANWVRTRGADTIFIRDNPATGAGTGIAASSYNPAGTAFGAGGQHAWEYRGVNTNAADCEVTVQMAQAAFAAVASSSAVLHLIVRSNPTVGQNFYYCEVRRSMPLATADYSLNISARIAGASTIKAGPTAQNAWNVSSKITLRAVGTVLTVLVDGSQVLTYDTAPDATKFASGAMGLGNIMFPTTLTSNDNYWTIDWAEFNDAYTAVSGIVPKAHYQRIHG
jgi:hypothetical protein